jgi:hypothetical protein
MGLFAQKLLVEEKSEAFILPLLKKRGWEISKHYPVRDARGDYKITRGQETFNIELKAEQRTTGNLFIEEFSNYAPGEYAPTGLSRTTLGWFLTLKADLVIYHFLDTDKVYKLDLKELQARPNLLYLKACERKQCQACDAGQQNATIGWCIPVELLLQTGMLVLLN